MRQWRSKIQSLRDEKRERARQTKKLRGRDVTQHETMKDAQRKVTRPAGRASTQRTEALDLEKGMQDVQEETASLGNTSEGRRASDAGGVQQGGANTSCCGGAAAGLESLKNSGMEDRSSRHVPSEQKYATCKNGLRTLAQRWKKGEEPETRGQQTLPATEGAIQVPTPVTPANWQRKHLGEDMNDAFWY